MRPTTNMAIAAVHADEIVHLAHLDDAPFFSNDKPHHHTFTKINHYGLSVSTLSISGEEASDAFSVASSPRRKRNESITMIGDEMLDRKTMSHMTSACASHPGHCLQVAGQVRYVWLCVWS